jgi:aminopeptidase 2
MENPSRNFGVKPTHYDLLIETDLDSHIFQGTVSIDIEVISFISFLTLHASSLSIHTVTLHHGEWGLLSTSGYTLDEKLETLQIPLQEPIGSGSKLRLKILFAGPISKTEGGFYIPDGTKGVMGGSMMGCTMLEPQSARKVFPCFDEPSLKATFSLTLVGDSRLTFLSNMPIKSAVEIKSEVGTEIPSSPRKIVAFETTPLMSTYLLAFAIGGLNYIESEPSDFRIQVRAYAPAGYDVEDSRFAVKLVCRAMNFFERTFKAPFPLPKLDLLCVPGAEGGMENWGLITLPMSVGMVSREFSGEEQMQAIHVLVHECAHMWLGDLVSIKGWGGLWLKEGLSEWAVMIALNDISEGLKSWEGLVGDGLQAAFESDSTRISHSLNLSDGSKLEDVYDDVTYKKGCAIFRMLADHLGEKLFLKGIRRYLEIYKYGNASAEDLWEIMTDVSEIDVAALVDTWSNQVGYPILSIKEDGEMGTIRITQSRFLSAGTLSKGEDQTIWPLFLRIRTEDGVLDEVLLERSNLITVPSSFYKINKNQIGFYRVAYPASRLWKLGDAILSGSQYLTPSDRAGLISDTAALVFSSYPCLRASNLLSFLQNFEGEESFVVSQIVISTFQTLENDLRNEGREIKEALGRFKRKLMRKALYRELDKRETDDLNEQRFKALLFGEAAEDVNIRSAAISMFDRRRKGDEDALSPNFRKEVFKIVMGTGDENAVSLNLKFERNEEEKD